VFKHLKVLLACLRNNGFLLGLKEELFFWFLVPVHTYSGRPAWRKKLMIFEIYSNYFDGPIVSD
jgi:hypothetical protein